MLDELEKMKIDFKQIAHYEIYLKLDTYKLPIDQSLHTCQKEQLSNRQWQNAFRELENKIRDTNMIYR